MDDSNEAKDNKIGMRVVRHIKKLRKIVGGNHLEALWKKFCPEIQTPKAIPAKNYEGESIDLESTKLSKTGEPFRRIYTQVLYLVCLRNNNFNQEVVIYCNN